MKKGRDIPEELSLRATVLTVWQHKILFIAIFISCLFIGVLTSAYNAYAQHNYRYYAEIQAPFYVNRGHVIYLINPKVLNYMTTQLNNFGWGGDFNIYTQGHYIELRATLQQKQQIDALTKNLRQIMTTIAEPDLLDNNAKILQAQYNSFSQSISQLQLGLANNQLVAKKVSNMPVGFDQKAVINVWLAQTNLALQQQINYLNGLRSQFQLTYSPGVVARFGAYQTVASLSTVKNWIVLFSILGIGLGIIGVFTYTELKKLKTVS